MKGSADIEWEVNDEGDIDMGYFGQVLQFEIEIADADVAKEAGLNQGEIRSIKSYLPVPDSFLGLSVHPVPVSSVKPSHIHKCCNWHVGNRSQLRQKCQVEFSLFIEYLIDRSENGLGWKEYKPYG